VADEGYQFDDLTGDAHTIADVNAATSVNSDYSIKADVVSQ
jgi:nitrogen fixation-related uncharacterized protein